MNLSFARFPILFTSFSYGFCINYISFQCASSFLHILWQGHKSDTSHLIVPPKTKFGPGSDIQKEKGKVFLLLIVQMRVFVLLHSNYLCKCCHISWHSQKMMANNSYKRRKLTILFCVSVQEGNSGCHVRPSEPSSWSARARQLPLLRMLLLLVGGRKCINGPTLLSFRFVAVASLL